MSGRAGRAGIDTEGESVLLAERGKPHAPLLALMGQVTRGRGIHRPQPHTHTHTRVHGAGRVLWGMHTWLGGVEGLRGAGGRRGLASQRADAAAPWVRVRVRVADTRVHLCVYGRVCVPSLQAATPISSCLVEGKKGMKRAVLEVRPRSTGQRISVLNQFVYQTCWRGEGHEVRVVVSAGASSPHEPHAPVRACLIPPPSIRDPSSSELIRGLSSKPAFRHRF
jgi:hypothetical protein